MATSQRIAIVTGGSRGMGRDTVLRLAGRGVSSILSYRSKEDEANNVVAEVENAGARAIAIQLDVGKSAAFDDFVTNVRAAIGQLGAEHFDYLVNNAGTSSSASLADGTEEEMDALFAVHFKAPFLLTQKLLPLMRDGGRIVNISSGLTRFTFPKRAIYAPMKAAVEALTRCMAVELGHRRIAVNTVAPGAIATDFSGGATRDNPEVNKAIKDRTALGRVGAPEDVGPVIASVLMDEFGFVNGQRIEVAGGFQV